MYAADALVSQGDVEVSVDVIDKLPVPFGLVRYGVAPDHFSIRSVRDTLDKIWDKPGVRFIGNVEVGKDISVAELHEYFDAVIFTYGAARDRRLGLDGEDLAGSVAATDLVAWYCGHPDADRATFEDVVPSATSAVVIGVGNVAVDVTRVLAKTVDELNSTDMPQYVFDTLGRSHITDVHVLGRRGPAQATFTTKELRELGELAEADILIDAKDLELDPVSAALVASDKVAARNLEVMREWSTRAPGGKPRRIHLHFFARPVELIGDDRVRQVTVERTELDANGQANGTGQTYAVDADLVVRSVGYRGEALEQVPFDSSRNVITNDEGRVMRDGVAVPGEYTAGWIKRGPSGIIGTNKKCAVQSVTCLLADAQAGTLPAAPHPSSGEFDARLSNVRVVDTAGWRKIDAAERALGATAGRDRTTIVQVDQLLSAADA